MRRVGKSRSALVAFLAASALVAAPVPAPAQGPDEYQLNLPDGGGGETDTGGGATEETAPAPVAPTAAPITEVPIAPVEVREKPKRERPDPVLGTTSPNATLGAERIPTLKVRGSDEGASIVPIGLAVLAAGCCLIAVWRLRFLRELPVSAHLPPATSESAAAARMRRERPAAARTARGAVTN